MLRAGSRSPPQFPPFGGGNQQVYAALCRDCPGLGSGHGLRHQPMAVGRPGQGAEQPSTSRSKACRSAQLREKADWCAVAILAILRLRCPHDPSQHVQVRVETGGAGTVDPAPPPDRHAHAVDQGPLAPLDLRGSRQRRSAQARARTGRPADGVALRRPGDPLSRCRSLRRSRPFGAGRHAGAVSDLRQPSR